MHTRNVCTEIGRICEFCIKNVIFIFHIQNICELIILLYKMSLFYREIKAMAKKMRILQLAKKKQKKLICQNLMKMIQYNIKRNVSLVLAHFLAFVVILSIP